MQTNTIKEFYKYKLLLLSSVPDGKASMLSCSSLENVILVALLPLLALTAPPPLFPLAHLPKFGLEMASGCIFGQLVTSKWYCHLKTSDVANFFVFVPFIAFSGNLFQAGSLQLIPSRYNHFQAITCFMEVSTHLSYFFCAFANLPQVNEWLREFICSVTMYL